MNRALFFLPALLLTLAACGGAEPPPAAPPPAAPAPAAAPAAQIPVSAAGLPPIVDEAMARVQGLFADPSDAAIKATFSPTFLASVSSDKVKALFTGIHGELGACKERRPVEVKSEWAAVVRLQCERGALNATVVVNGAPPHLIEGLLLKPAP